jgi:predicted metal-dependent hydrolase
MSIETRQITISGLPVQIVRKNIKNLHLGVYPPHGRVRVAAPLRVSDKAVRLAVIGKLGWIKRHRARFVNQPRQSAREMVSGESHYFLGQRYRLRVIQQDGGSKVVLRNKSIIELYVRPKSSVAQRNQVLQNWYRQQLRELMPPLLAKWQAAMAVHLAECGIKKMKTRWGSCNPITKRIWLNLELAKKPAKCLEYIIVHELTHLIERRHNDHFVSLMDEHMPQWRLHRQELNSTPLAHETWSY